MSAVVTEDIRIATYRMLIRRGRQGSDAHLLAAMLASNWHRLGAMPACLGLDSRMFGWMLDHYFPGLEWPGILPNGGQWDTAAMPEYHELKGLFTEYQAPHLRHQPWWIELLITGCNGRNHLWEDLGLFTRADLNKLMHLHFPELAARNDRDMKWKKFLYKQLCEREGIIACPTPSCDACAHFSECFAPED
jgi:nitrogen fixation protein NifQ